jgi:hypothetical protein
MPVTHALPKRGVGVKSLSTAPKAHYLISYAFLWDNSPRQDGAERRINVGQKEFYLDFLGQMLFNVLYVNICMSELLPVR